MGYPCNNVTKCFNLFFTLLQLKPLPTLFCNRCNKISPKKESIMFYIPYHTLTLYPINIYIIIVTVCYIVTTRNRQGVQRLQSCNKVVAKYEPSTNIKNQ